MPDYSISEAFQQIEDYLIDSMIRNLSHHVGLEQAEGINYTQWQAEQLAALAEYRRTNAEKFTDYFSQINARITVALNRAAQLGETEQEQAILKALQSGWKRPRHAKDYGTDRLSGAFFRVNDRKLNAYIAAVKRDMKKAETALLRMADDQYRKAIFNAGVAYNTGIYTLPQAIDSATKDMLSRGLNCIEYKNGARVCIDTYAEMALRTSATRCYLQGESRKRDEWGVNTVIVNKRGIACPKCLKYVGRVFYDDVYGSVPVPDDKYPRLSEAIAGGLYHPNCKDIHTTWFEGISTPPVEMSEADKKKAEENYKLEQRQRYNERQIRKYKRLSAGTLDPEEKQRYTKRLVQWENYNANFIEQHGDVLRQRAEREKIRDLTISVPPPFFSERLREFSTPQGMLKAFRERAENDETAMLERYQAVLGKLCPDSLDKFLDMKYNNPGEWQQLLYNYRTVNRYEVIGTVSPEKIIELDNAAWYTKQKGLDVSKVSKAGRNGIQRLKSRGNAAVLELDGEIFFAHSALDKPGTAVWNSYVGPYKLIGLSNNRRFQVLDLGDGVKREKDTEAKFFEYIAAVKKPTDIFEVTVLSEKYMCDSCLGVMKQFLQMFPNATVNVVSGKRKYNGDPKGLNTWKYRKRVQ